MSLLPRFWIHLPFWTDALRYEIILCDKEFSLSFGVFNLIHLLVNEGWFETPITIINLWRTWCKISYFVNCTTKRGKYSKSKILDSLLCFLIYSMWAWMLDFQRRWSSHGVFWIPFGAEKLICWMFILSTGSSSSMFRLLLNWKWISAPTYDKHFEWIWRGWLLWLFSWGKLGRRCNIFLKKFVWEELDHYFLSYVKKIFYLLFGIAVMI